MIVLGKNVPKCIYPALTYKHLNYMAHGDIMYLCLSTHMKTIQLGHRLVITSRQCSYMKPSTSTLTALVHSSRIANCGLW